jgi:DNA-binding MarR family transcriptional regulator
MSDLKLDRYLPYRLSVAANAVSDLIARAYKQRFGLTVPQWRLIAVLGEDGEATPQSLGQRTVMDKVTVSRAAAGLLARGILQRSPNADDGRSHRLALSGEGRALYEEIAPLALEYETYLLAPFKERERQTAHDLLRRLEAVAMLLNDAAPLPVIPLPFAGEGRG